MDNNSVRARLLASSDRESLLNSSSIAGYNNPFHKQKQLGNYFSDKIFLVDEWHSEEYLNPYDDSRNGDATWRLKERMKTAGVALVVCLNIGIDPPDIVRPNPSARKECWFDPIGPKQKGLEFIGNALQQQYEKWQPKAKYKQCLDPTSEELRRVCMNLRKGSKGDRLLLHYNGHGVPRPTKNGELWVFGKHYTHYTPVAICELRTWLGDPAIYVLDCSGAGVLISHLVDNMTMKQQSMSPIGFDLNSGGVPSRPGSTAPGATPGGAGGGPSEGSTIVLAACKANEILPLNPQYPADIFTACLTTPIVIAMRWFILQNPYSMRDINPDIAENLPGKDNDRKTPRGELNWIFTAITDTIAWNTLPSKIFQKMFRQDLLVASLFRNFLLAKRIMKSLGCTPQSWPQLPDSTTHPLWQSWDLTLESFIMYNASLVKGSMMVDPRNNMSFGGSGVGGGGVGGASHVAGGLMGGGMVGTNASLAAAGLSSNLSFFTDQLTAFELWLDFSSVTSEPPSHLPIVLQVLLSQTHRLRALLLLKRYLALGAEAVNLSLLVGIFPYILKLLQSPADDIKQILVSIWASIIGFDSSCRQELVREKAQPYFVQYLIASGMPPAHRCLAAFVLSEICSNYREGQQTCLQLGLHRSCTSILGQPDVLSSGSLKRWVCLCLYKLCEDFLWAKYLCITEAGHTFLYPLLYDSDPTVRAAAVLALGEIFGASALTPSQAAGGGSTPKRPTPTAGGMDERPKGPPAMEEKDLRETELQLAQQILECCMDGSVIVRVEAVFALSKFFIQPAHLDCLKIVAKAVCKRNYDKSALQQAKQERKSISPPVDKINFLYPWHLTPTENRDICALVEDFLEGKVAGAARGQALRPASPPHVPYQMGATVSLLEEQRKPAAPGPEVPVPNRGRVMSKDSTDTAGTAGNPSTPALSNLMAGAYVKLWLALTEVQGKDPCHTVSSAAGTIRNRVVALIAMDEKKAQYERQIIESGGQLVNQSVPQLNPLTIATPESSAFLSSFSSGSYASPYATSSYLIDPRDGTNGGLGLGGPPGAAGGIAGGAGGGDPYSSGLLSPLGVVGSNTNPFGSPSSRHKNIKTGSKLPKSSPFLLNGQQQAGTNSDFSFSTPVAADRPSTGSKQDPNLLRQSLNNSTSQSNLSAAEAKSLRLSSLSPFGGSSSSAAKSSNNLQSFGSSHGNREGHAGGDQQGKSKKRHSFLAPWMDESVKELLDLQEEDLLVSFTSNYYEMTKRIFLEPDVGFDPYTDPLSTEGKSRTYRNTKQLEIIAHEAYLQSVFKDIDDRSDSFLIAEQQSRNNKVASGSSHGNKGAANKDLDEAQTTRSALVSALSPQVSRFEQKALLNIENAMMTSLVMFHAFQDVLAVCDGSSVGIWSLNTCSRIMEVKNKNHSSVTPQPTVAAGNGRRSPVLYNEPPSVFTPMAAARITTMAWINESYDALLLLGSDDGIIKVWRDTSSSDVIATHNNGVAAGIERQSSVRDSVNNVAVNQTSTCELASTFAALPDVSETSRGSGIVLSWRQASGTLCVGGNSSSIRLWDLGREQCIRSFNSGSDTCLTAMASTAVPGKFSTSSNNVADYQNISADVDAPQMSWIFAGFADGSIGAFDERVYTNGGRIHSARDHSAWIISAHLRADIPEVITASVRGSVKFWDLRTMRTYKTLEVQKSPLTALAVHNCAPIMATGSHAQFIKILTLGGEQLGNIIKYHDGFLGQRIGPVSCLAFHPHRMLLAASSTDSIVSIYSTADNNLNS